MKTHNYFHIDLLPSKFRSYSIDSIAIRGLTFDEVLGLSKKNNSDNLQLHYLIELLNNNIIKNIDIKELEVIDFNHLLLILFSYTDPAYFLRKNIKCYSCKKQQNFQFFLEKFDYINENIINKTFLETKDKTKYYPLKVKHIVEYFHLKKDKQIQKKYYPMLLNWIRTENTSSDFDDFKYSTSFEEFLQLENKFYINIKPLQFKCLSCKKIISFKFNVNNILAFINLFPYVNQYKWLVDFQMNWLLNFKTQINPDIEMVDAINIMQRYIQHIEKQNKNSKNKNK